MKKLALLFSVAILATSCTAQENNKSIAQNDKSTENAVPQGNWTVNKEVDENGNIIRYDSIYSWSSSSTNGFTDRREINPDSIMKAMRERMRLSFGTMNADPFAGFFGNDSTQTDPFSHDPFFDQFFGNSSDGFPNIDEIQKQMRAMQQQFFQREEQPWIPAVPEEELKEKKTKYAQKSI